MTLRKDRGLYLSDYPDSELGYHQGPRFKKRSSELQNFHENLAAEESFVQVPSHKHYWRKLNLKEVDVVIKEFQTDYTHQTCQTFMEQ
ncbi:unnamed protein product [Ambrosiozyma monospora]|uniref:Unnamed protein product n=1 Tax=Ambrosiozyma monospora TaxID=43982 RepID=A0A9W6Z4C7_AMBMO|nr:unnamed protein product [Ambrosiozyma monospora]